MSIPPPVPEDPDGDEGGSLCEVCGATVADDATACATCGTDFTNRAGERGMPTRSMAPTKFERERDAERARRRAR